jgi:hypothetical protein
MLRIRALSAEDPADLVRLGDGSSVVEYWTAPVEGSVYRAPAEGVPVAIVGDVAGR